MSFEGIKYLGLFFSRYNYYVMNQILQNMSLRLLTLRSFLIFNLIVYVRRLIYFSVVMFQLFFSAVTSEFVTRNKPLLRDSHI